MKSVKEKVPFIYRWSPSLRRLTFWRRAHNAFNKWRSLVNTPNLIGSIISRRLADIFQNDRVPITEDGARTLINSFVRDGLNFTTLGKVMHFPIGSKTFREWAEPCIQCEKRSKRIRQNCKNKCINYCEPCYEKFQPQFCNACDSAIEYSDISENRIRSIGEQAFRRVTTNVVFTLQKLRANQTFTESLALADGEPIYSESEMEIE